MKTHDLPFNKANFINLKKERDMLKITLQYITEENENLKNELNDMKITAKKNKDMLREYINQITNKDKLFEKMASTIEQLKSRLKAMEQFKKEKEKIEKESNGNYFLSNDYLNINNNTNYHSTTTTSNNLTTNNIIGTTGGENSSFGFNILNSNNINKTKCYNTNAGETNSKANKSMININAGNKNGLNILRNNQKNKNQNSNINNINNIINKAKNIKYNNNHQILEDNNKEDKKNIPPDTNINNIKFLYEKQKNIMEEILGIKDDIQFLMENKSKSKIRDKLNQSLASCNNSLNSSFCSEHKNIDENNKDNFNNSFISENNGQQSIDNSYISQNISNLSVSYYGADQNILRHLNYTLNTSSANNNPENYVNENNSNIKYLKKRKNFNLKERYAIDENFSNFIAKTNIKKDMLFLIDGKENVWEIVRRGDLTAEQIKKYDKERDKEYFDKIKSVINLIGEKNNNEQNLMNLIAGGNKNGNYMSELDKDRDTNFLDNNLIDIEIKEPTDIIFK
jgi:hypothetical protein